MKLSQVNINKNLETEFMQVNTPAEISLRQKSATL